MPIEYVQLQGVDPQAIIALMNDPLVRKQMPLAFDDFNEQDCENFVKVKQQLWQEHGYGPWAFVVDGEFAGWGGLQPEDGIPDLALVLSPKYWGIVKDLAKQIIEKAFTQMQIEYLTVLFPPTRTKVEGLLKLGFKQTGKQLIEGKEFIRYGLRSMDWP